METIFISVASYMDLELTNTVYSALSQASNPSRLFFSVFSQDKDEDHPKLDKLFDMFDVYGFEYEKINYVDAKGVGFARHKTQEPLTDNFTYYLQVDSHTQFRENWDDILIDDYVNAEKFWGGKMIFTAYPGTYTYTDTGNVKISEIEIPTKLRIQPSANTAIVYEPKYTQYNGGYFGEFHAYFCAGFAFGRSQYFIDVPYDQYLYFNGEEQSLSIRFYCKDIKLIAPSKHYVFHHYSGTKRSRHWEKTPNWDTHEKVSIDRLDKFFNGYDLDGFGISDLAKYQDWIDCFLTPAE